MIYYMCRPSDLGLVTCVGPVPDVDVSQLKNGRGVESALHYAKAWSRYTKDLLAWVDKRISLGGSAISVFCYSCHLTHRHIHFHLLSLSFVSFCSTDILFVVLSCE